MDGLKIAFWSAGNGMWGELYPEALEEDRQLGGAEAALIHVSRGLAEHGHDVTVFHGDCPRERDYDVQREHPEFKHSPYRWKQADMYNPRECYDALILWDDSSICQYDPCAHAVILSAHCNTQPHLRDHYRISWSVMGSEWQRKVLCQQYRILSIGRSETIHLGVDLSRYEEDIEAIPNRIIYCSSPDRGLHHLLRIWPQVREQIPDAELHTFYSFGGFERNKWRMDKYASTWWEVRSHLDQPGVVNHGPIGKQALAREQKKAALLAYPSDLYVDGETFGMVVLECMAAGVPTLISDAASLPGVYGDAAAILPRPIEDEHWIAAIVRLLTEKDLRQTYIERGLEFAREHTWDKAVEAWDKTVRERVRDHRLDIAGGFIPSDDKPMGNIPALGTAQTRYPALKQGRP